MASLESKVEFDEAIKEIQLLILYSKKNKKDFRKYAAFNKAAIVLLCAKFEAFLETFLDEYSFTHLTNSSNKNLDSHIFEHLIDNILDTLEQTKSNKVRRKFIIKELISLCSDTEISSCSNFKVKAKLKLGKHGQNEVERLLKTFGFTAYIAEQSVQDFFSKFNSLNNIRNNIIHEDATPSLTHQDVENYLTDVKKFAASLDSLAQHKLLEVSA
jgi:RiboL-PSP-HEPN